MLRQLVVFLLLLVAPVWAQVQDPFAAKHAWSIAAYSFPSHPLAYGFTSRERGRLRAPDMPAEKVSAEEEEAFLKKSHQIVGHFLEMEGVSLPKGSLVTFDPGSLTLVARVPGLTHWSLNSMAVALQAAAVQIVPMRGMILEAGREEVLKTVEEAAPLKDHTKILDSLKAVATTEILATMQTNCRSGQATKSDEKAEWLRPSEWNAHDSGFVGYDRSLEPTGTSWEMDAVIGPDGETVDMNVKLEHTLAAAVEQEELMAEWQGKKMVAVHRNESTAEITTSLSMRSGETRLLGVWPSPRKDRFQCAFLSVHLVRVLPLRSERLLQMVQERGEKVMPIPPGKPKFFEEQVEGIPEGMFVQRFRVAPSFLSAESKESAPASGGDPFSTVGEPRFTIRATAMDILKSVGVPFPPGSSANYLAQTNELIVRNTPENLDLVAAYVSSLKCDVQKAVILTAYIVQAPTKLVRELGDQMLVLPDHRDAWRVLQAAQEAKVMSVTWIEARSGQMSKVTSGDHYGYVSEVNVNPIWKEPVSKEKEEKPEGSKQFSFLTDSERVGTALEVDPVVGPDGQTIDVNVSLIYDYAPPSWVGAFPQEEDRVVFKGPQLRFFRNRIGSSLTMRSGCIRLLGYWKPDGQEDAEAVRQMAFLRAVIVSRDEEKGGTRYEVRE